MSDISNTDLSGVVTNLKTIRGEYGDGVSFILEQTFESRDGSKLNKEEITAWTNKEVMDGLEDGMSVMILNVQKTVRKDGDTWRTYFKVKHDTQILLKPGKTLRSQIKPDFDEQPPTQPVSIKSPGPVTIPRPKSSPAMPKPVALPRPPQTTQAPAPAPTPIAKIDPAALVARMRSHRQAQKDVDEDVPF